MKQFKELTSNLHWGFYGVAAGLVLGLWSHAAAADGHAAAVNILQTKCAGCHSGDEPKGGLHLDAREGALAGGNSGDPAILPGQAVSSRLVKFITLPPDHKKLMPPASKPGLTPDEILSLIHWINRGAEWAEASAEAPAPAPAAEAKPAAEGTKVDFASQILPILVDRCVSCHGPEKQKGQLRVDTPEHITEGEIVVAGKPAESLLCQLISLPADHDDIMPAKGDPLTKEQIGLIARWIKEGASYEGDGAPAAVAKVEPIENKATGPVIPASTALVDIAKNVSPADEAAVEALRNAGAIAMPLSADSPLLSVDFKLSPDKVNDESLAQLAALADQITWLNLAGASVTDDQLKHVAALKHLTRLHLEKTAVTDAGLAHVTGLSHLEYINLYKTQVSDAGLAHLKGLKELRNVYLWQSQVSEDGATALEGDLPYAKINVGSTFTPVVEVKEEEIKFAHLFDAESCCGKALAEGKACDHPCCKEAITKTTVCAKCNAGAVPKLALIAAFGEGSCCAQAHADGKPCDHPCCTDAATAKSVCEKCNPGAAEKLAKEDAA
jgi:mono/diheme cytochrome c family protein